AIAASAVASASSVAITWPAIAGVSSGRAASCTSTGSPASASSSAQRTDSERVDPPSTASTRSPELDGSAVPGGSATTICSIASVAASACSDHWSMGRPASSTSAFGRPAPRRSPLPAATIRAIAIAQRLEAIRRRDCRARSRRGPCGHWSVRESPSVGRCPCQLARCRGGKQLVEVALGLFLVLVQRIHQLGREDLLGAGEHLLLARREPLLALPQRQVAHDLGELVDVARLDLVAVVLEAAVPVLGHLGDLVPKHVQDLLDRLLVDHPTQTGQ